MKTFSLMILCGFFLSIVFRNGKAREWIKICGPREGCCVQQTSDGGYIITGQKDKKILLVKTDSLGDTLWTRIISDTSGMGHQV